MPVMRTHPRRLIGALIVGCLLLAPVVAGAPASTAVAKRPITDGPPTDYMKVKGLSQPRYDTQRDSHLVEMEDGINLYVEVVRPKAPGRFPVVLELSPYHGTIADRDGTRILPGPKNKNGEPIGLTGYFAPRGYAVVIVDLRGTGRSQGCLDHMGKLDQSDAKAIVEWAAKQKWSNGKVGMTGHSYVGSTPQMAAAQKPKGLATIVPSAGLAAMYHHEFQLGVPYFLQWAGPLFAYELLSMERHLPYGPYSGAPGDHMGKDMQYFGCGWKNSAAVTGEAYVSGAETDWHRERDFRKGVANAKIPVFIVHGVNDNAARIPAIDWFVWRDGRHGDKAWIGQWDHGSGTYPNNRTCPQGSTRPCEEDQWTLALHAWFDKHLMGRDVDTGPAAEIFLNNGEVFTASSYPPKVDGTLKLIANSDGSLAPEANEESGVVRYVADQRGQYDEFGTGHVSFTTKPFKKDTLIVGVPKMRLTVSVTSPRIHLIGTLYDVKGNNADRIGRAGFAIQPELRNGIDKPEPVIPGQEMTIELDGMPQAHLIEKGHSLMLVIASSHPDKVATFGGGAVVNVVTGGENGTQLKLPVIYEPKLYADPMPTAAR